MLTLAVALAIAPNWSQKLPDGTTVKIVALANEGTKKFWTPDGKSTKTPSIPRILNPHYSGAPVKQLSNRTSFFLQISPSTLPSVAFKFGDRTLSSGFTLMDDKNPKLWWAGGPIDNRKLLGAIDLKVGVGVGKWKATAMHNLQSGESKGPKFFGFILRDLKQPTLEKSIALDCTIPKSIKGKMAYDIKVFDITGKALTPAGSGPMKAGQPPRYFFRDSGNRLAHVDLLTRPYKWLTFKGVRTKANQ